MQGEFPLSGGAGKESWATRDKAPIPNLPYGSIQTLVCIVLYLYVDVRPSRQFFFVFVKKNSLLGTITTIISITIITLIYYLLHLYTLMFSLFMLTLCCVALPIDHSFSVFITV